MVYPPGCMLFTSIRRDGGDVIPAASVVVIATSRAPMYRFCMAGSFQMAINAMPGDGRSV